MTVSNILLIGAGKVSQYHAEAVGRLLPADQVKLSVADPNPAALEQFGRSFPHTRLFRDAHAMLAQPAGTDDIVIVATPAFTHFELGSAALQSGRHVLCEKPLVMNRPEALQLLQLARTKGRLISCCSDRFTGMPTTETVKRLIREGKLGTLYHITFVHRSPRQRSGIEFQPASRWFLDRSKNGGGILMNWGPYDFTVLSDVLAPVSMDVMSAWMVTPTTALSLPPGTVYDVEEHAGASLRYHLADGTTVAVTYERAACTHGEVRVFAEVEGTRGSVHWDWMMFENPARLNYSYDHDGKAQIDTTMFENPMSCHDRPLHYLCQAIAGQPSLALVNEQAVFNISCLRAVYDCVESGKPQTVTRSEL